MKAKERLIHICFLINAIQSIGFIALFVVIIPLAMINPRIPETIFSLFKNKAFGLVHTGLTMCSIVNWIYCLRFWYKYDRYSKAIFPLIFPHVIYAPWYYYQVKIKKRPLKGKLIEKNSEKSEETEDLSISDSEFIDLTRKNVFGVIDLWASKEKQLDYQEKVPIAQVSAELFCQWEDFYFPDSDDFKQAFENEELEILSDFDKVLNDIVEKTPQDLPLIDVFVETNEWIEMNKKAIEIQKQLITVGNMRYKKLPGK